MFKAKIIRPKERFIFIGGCWFYSKGKNGAYLYWGDKTRLAYMGRFKSLKELKLSLLKQRIGLNFRVSNLTKKGCMI